MSQKNQLECFIDCMICIQDWGSTECYNIKYLYKKLQLAIVAIRNKSQFY